MSLVAWYKLDGNANDSSGNGNHGTATNVSWVDGKIAQAGDFNGSSYVLSAHSNTLDTKGSFSVSLWVNMTSIATGGSFTGGVLASKGAHSTRGWHLGIDWNNLYFGVADSSGNSSISVSSINTVLVVGEWHYVTAVYDYSSGFMSIYIDGILKSSDTRPVRNPSCTDNLLIGRGYSYLYGNLDDVRIYDHALSEKEVKELSKGKVLHYKFDDFQEPTTNLIESIGDVVRCAKSGNGVLIDWTTNFGDTYFRFNLKSGTTLTTGDIYTLSFDCSGLPEGKVVKFAWSNVTTIVCTLQNGRNELTFAIPSVTNAFFDDIVKDATINNLYLYNFQLEAKNHATPFTPTIRTGLVKDISGYENNAELTESTTPRWMEEGIIGKGSYLFNGTTSGIERIGDFSDIKTISMWVKSQTVPTDSRVLLVHQPTGVGLGFYNNGYLILTSQGNSQRTAIISNFKNNDWNHISVTYSDAKVPTCYINGVETTYSTTNSWNVSETTLYIGRRTSGSAFNGQIDDVRIYATALSADDVKELYQTKANLDKSGNMSVMNINQIDTTNLEVKTNGILNSADVSEVGVTDGLVAWYPLDGNTRDYTEYRNDATNYGATMASGLDQLCYSFDGVDDYIISGHQSYLNSLPISVFCWFYRNEGTLGDLVNKYYSSSVNGWSFTVGTEGGLRLYFFGSGSRNISNYNSFEGASSSQAWHHAGFVADSAGGKLFLDGEQIAFHAWTGEPIAPSTTESLSFSRYPGATAAYREGKIQDVRIYNRALSAEEIKILYELRKNKKTHFTNDNKVFIPGKFNEVY